MMHFPTLCVGFTVPSRQPFLAKKVGGVNNPLQLKATTRASFPKAQGKSLTEACSRAKVIINKNTNLQPIKQLTAIGISQN